MTALLVRFCKTSFQAKADESVLAKKIKGRPQKTNRANAKLIASEGTI